MRLPLLPLLDRVLAAWWSDRPRISRSAALYLLARLVAPWWPRRRG